MKYYVGETLNNTLEGFGELSYLADETGKVHWVLGEHISFDDIAALAEIFGGKEVIVEKNAPDDEEFLLSVKKSLIEDFDQSFCE